MRSWTANWRRLLALDEDGTACSSDYYLRLTSDGGRMLKGQIALTATRPTPPTTTSENPDLALNKPVSASGYTQTYVPSNAVDGDASTYWESTDSAFPQWFQVDLGAVTSISRIVMDLPPSSAWGARTQALEIQGSTDGSSYTTIAGSQGYGFDPATGNTATATFSATSVRYVKLTFTANTGWPAGQLSELQTFAS